MSDVSTRKEKALLVVFHSGRRMDIPDHHCVFYPVGDFKEGDVVDPVTVLFVCERATTLTVGVLVIIDNVVEIVENVTFQEAAMTIKSLLCSDIHLRRRIDEQYALEQLVKAAIKHKVKNIIAAGDLFNMQTNRAGAISFFYKQLDVLEEAGIDFYYTQGQHCMDEPPWLSGHRHAQHAHKHMFELGPHLAYALDFQPFGKLQEELDNIPMSCDMLITHQTWGDWMGNITVPQGEFSQVPGNIEAVYSGDLHQWKLERIRNQDNIKMLVCSSGAVAQQKIDEPEEHYYVILTGEGAFSKQKLKSRVFIDSSLLITQQDLTRFMEEIEEIISQAIQKAVSYDFPDEMCKPRLRVTFSHKLTDAVRRIEKVVANRATIFWKELPPEEKQAKKKLAKPSSDQAITPLTALADVLDKKVNPETFELTSRLLQSANPEEEFQRWWLEQMGEQK